MAFKEGAMAPAHEPGGCCGQLRPPVRGLPFKTISWLAEQVLDESDNLVADAGMGWITLRRSTGGWRRASHSCSGTGLGRRTSSRRQRRAGPDFRRCPGVHRRWQICDERRIPVKSATCRLPLANCGGSDDGLLVWKHRHRGRDLPGNGNAQWDEIVEAMAFYRYMGKQEGNLDAGSGGRG